MIPFQSTPLREGRQDDAFVLAKALMFQSTPLREGRQTKRSRTRSANKVSIHAPARGAT